MRRFKIPFGVIVFIAVWLLALCVPTTREIPYSGIVLGWLGQQNDEAIPHLASELARQFPDEPVAVGWAAEDASPVGNRSALDVAGARFPNDMAVRALRLKINSPRSSTGDYQARPDLEASKNPLWLRQAQIARGGAQLEADNAFWPWMEAAFLYAARRDDAALAAMQRAGVCTRYQDYSMSISRQRIALAERHGTVSYETKIGIWAATLYPQLSWLRSAARVASRRGRQLREAGQTQRAIAIEAAVLNASFLLQRDADSTISALVGQSIGQSSLRDFFDIDTPKNLRNLPPAWVGFPSENNPEVAAHLEELARTWGEFANANGQPQQAERAAFVADMSLQRELSAYWASGNDTIWTELGLTPVQGALTFLTPAALFLLASAILTGASLWLLGAFLRPAGEAPARGQAVGCANFSFWLLAGMTAVCCALFVRPVELFVGNASLAGGAIIFGFLAMCAASWMLPVWFTSWRHNKGTGRAPQKTAPSGWMRWAPLCVRLFALLTTILLAFNFLIGASLVSDPLLIAVVAASWLMTLGLSWRGNNVRSWWQWQLAHRSLGILLVMWSVVFLVSSLGLWPLRTQLHRNLERRLQIGEIAWMREQVATSR